MTAPIPVAADRLSHLADIVEREALYLAQTDERLFATGFGQDEAESLPQRPDLAERVEAFIARLGRLQETIANALLPRLLDALQEPVASVIDNLNRAERLGFVESVAAWSRLRTLRNRMIHEYLDSPRQLAGALQAAHVSVPVVLAAAKALVARVRTLAPRS